MTNELNESKWAYGADKHPPSPDPQRPQPQRPSSPASASSEDLTRLKTGRWVPGEVNVKTDTMQLGRVDIADEPSEGASRVDPNRRQQRSSPTESLTAGGPAVGAGKPLRATDSVFDSSAESDLTSDSVSGGGSKHLDDDLDGHLDDDLDRSDSARNMIEWAVVLVASVLIALLIRAFLVQAFWIPSSSMETTLMVKDRVLVNKLGYRIGDVNRGDIVVFRKTEVEIVASPDDPKDVIKRVVALSGETVLIKDNQVIVDDQLLLEPYLDPGIVTSDFGPTVVPDGHVFVMGDNRGDSKDSRFELGPVSEDRIVGRAFFTFWPVDSLGGL